MIIAHSAGEEVFVLCTSTIIFSYLVNYIDFFFPFFFTTIDQAKIFENPYSLPRLLPRVPIDGNVNRPRFRL